MSHTSSKLARVMVHSAFGLSIAAIVCGGTALAQTGGGAARAMLQQKLAAIKTSAAENQQKLHQYTWTETTTITANGRQMPPKVATASYGADGKVHKVPVEGSSSEASQGRRRGRLMQRVMEKKKADMKDYAQQVSHVIGLYIPPNPQKMEQAFKAKKVSFNHNGNTADLVFKDYALPGDSMAIGIDKASHKMRSINVNTYLDSPQDPVKLAVQFATLPDGTSHPSRTTLDAQGKDLHVVTTNTDYRKTR